VIIVDDCEQSWHRLQVVIRRFTLQELNDCAAQTPNIRRRRGTREFNNLGRHPVGRANDLCLLVWTCQRAGGDSKVCQLDLSIFGGQDIGAFDVAMDHTLVVEVVQSLQYLCHVNTDEVLRELAVRFTY